MTTTDVYRNHTTVDQSLQLTNDWLHRDLQHNRLCTQSVMQ